jgi:hypothetical protein
VKPGDPSYDIWMPIAMIVCVLVAIYGVVNLLLNPIVP